MLHNLGLFYSFFLAALALAHAIEGVSGEREKRILGNRIFGTQQLHLGHDFVRSQFFMIYGRNAGTLRGIPRAVLVSTIVFATVYLLYFLNAAVKEYPPFGQEPDIIDHVSGYSAFWYFNPRFFLFVNVPVDASSVAVSAWILNRRDLSMGRLLGYSLFALSAVIAVFGLCMTLFNMYVTPLDIHMYLDFACDTYFQESREGLEKIGCLPFDYLPYWVSTTFLDSMLAVRSLDLRPLVYNTAAGTTMSFWLGSLGPYVYSSIFSTVWIIMLVILGASAGYFTLFSRVAIWLAWLIDYRKYPLKFVVILMAALVFPIVLFLSFLFQ
jgi:hypothetical protein